MAREKGLNAGGYMYDTLHPKAPVYQAEGYAVADVIKALAEAKSCVARRATRLQGLKQCLPQVVVTSP